jgi:RIO-like serine/threonine protein kinase
MAAARTALEPGVTAVGVDVLDRPVGTHYESDISFEADPVRGILVTKTYRTGHECVQWLNRHLARYYDAAKGQPVAQHEYAALTLLEPYGIAPKAVEFRPDSIVMEFAGTPISLGVSIPTETYLMHCQRILDTLERLHFRHNDLLPSNVLVHEGQVKIADFTLAEFGRIQIMKDLPNPAWARPGQDRNILSYAPLHSEPGQTLFGRVTKLLKRLKIAAGGP